jgi:hypothetical protein
MVFGLETKIEGNEALHEESSPEMIATEKD